jgi:hypothetical protein
MFAVIGKKIFDKLNDSTDFITANDGLGAELIVNGVFEAGNITGWDLAAGATNTSDGVSDYADITSSEVSNEQLQIADAFITKIGTKYLLSIERVLGGNTSKMAVNTTPETSTSQTATAGVELLIFTATSTSTSVSVRGGGAEDRALFTNVSIKEIKNKVFPVIIPQGTSYPATTFEIANVDNFITKSSSLESCDVSLRIACFADNYNTTYNQSKAVVEALDYYSVTYTEDGVSYTAKFRFVSLDDDYYKLPEKFYKNLIFNCLITKN